LTAARAKAAAAALTPLPWRPAMSGGAAAAGGALGAIRTKKWKPFHNMYRSNFLRELGRKRAAKEAAAAAAGEGGVESSGAVAARAFPQEDEPVVATTPFQAARIMRAFDTFPDPNAIIQFRTKLRVDLTRESVRGTCHLPHGLHTKVRVLAFCPDEDAEEMLRAGADFAGITEVTRRIGQGWFGFDRCLASPAIMPQVLKVAKILGPRKLMPNPKSGTVVLNLKQAIAEAKGGTLLEYRAEGAGDLQVAIGDASFSDAKLLDNVKFLVQTLLRNQPRAAAPKAGGKTPGAPLIPGIGVTPESAGNQVKESYFLDASLQLGDGGPLIRIVPDTMLPASVGYFR